jgi:hypothetical protein
MDLLRILSLAPRWLGLFAGLRLARLRLQMRRWAPANWLDLLALFAAAAALVAIILGIAASATAAEPIVLECDLLGGGNGVYIGFGSPWHGMIAIDNTWTVDDYTFSKDFGADSGTFTISRSTGAITQISHGWPRTGSCKAASRENRKF